MKKIVLFIFLLIVINSNNLMSQSNTSEVATLAAGCFWCVEAVYERIQGVSKVESGFSGGYVKNPAYKEVITGTTGHAEVCQITFNPQVISFAEVLEVFFAVHDPTTLNRQGNDVGTQYRSAIFYHSPEQKKVAEETIDKLTQDEEFKDPIVTEVTEFEAFYVAEDYHQDYFENNPNQPYCSFVVAPKVKKFEAKFDNLLK
jgi:peptide-methionine (S)-S-oxide reductase